MIYILIILSFVLESIITNMFSLSTFLAPFFTIISLVVLYPYFKNNNIFMISCILCGIIYDISYTDSAFLNTLSFGLCGCFIVLFNIYFKYNIYSSIILNLIIIVIYRTISYSLLVVVGYFSFNKEILLTGVYKSLIVNLVYGIIIYWVCKKFNFKKS